MAYGSCPRLLAAGAYFVRAGGESLPTVGLGVLELATKERRRGSTLAAALSALTHYSSQYSYG